MYAMKRYSVAAVRQRLAEALDEAERGVPVIIERKGVRYRLAVEAPKAKRRARHPAIELLDPAIAEGQWSWKWVAGGLRFRSLRGS